jgi:hypothetical protein
MVLAVGFSWVISCARNELVSAAIIITTSNGPMGRERRTCKADHKPDQSNKVPLSWGQNLK